jgi:hypothetical protein
MKELPTYDNDKDLAELIKSKEITQDNLLRFFFKKGGYVNHTNLRYLISEYATDKNGFYQALVDLETSAKIKFVGSHIAKLTFKAWWERLRDNKTIVTVGVICGIIAFLILLMQVFHIL